MARNLKALGALLAVAFAVGGLTLTPASAVEEEAWLTADGAITYTFLQKETGKSFLTFGEKIDCPGSIYTGHKLETTPHVPAAAKDDELTITPHYKNCVSGGTKKATVTMNGCDFETELKVAGGQFRFKVFIACPPGKDIVEDIYASKTDETLKICEIHTGPQELAGTVTVKETSGKLDTEGAFTGIKSTRTGLCGSSESKEGEMTFDTEVEGRNEAGEFTATSLSK
jgi:hypothetical protein